MTALWILLAVIIAFLAIIVVRACMFKPSSEKKVEADSFSADTKAAAEHLRQMVRLKTVSSVEESQVDLGEFEKFRALLRTLYPHVYAVCEYSEIGRHGMLLKWAGRSAEQPSVLMAHYDVVPADPAEWDEAPFEGIVKGGELWGRGTLDTKCTLMGVMEAAESLIARGFTPKSDVYFAFGGDEEVMGGDAPAIVAELERRGVHPAFVLDEGGAIVEKVFPGVDQPAALIGIAEKGSAFLDLTAVGKGGHASAPPEFSLFDPKFLEEVARMKERNFAVELLRRLIAEQVQLYQRTNTVRAEKFSEILSDAMSRYLKGMLTNEEVIEELLKIAREIVFGEKAGESLNLNSEELAFYDALTKPEAVKDFYSNDQLIAITRELTDALRRNKTIDWNMKESARAGMRRIVKRLLKKYDYPPAGQEDALNTIMEQCKKWNENN